MTPDQERLLREWAEADPLSNALLPSTPHKAIKAVAQVVLELVEQARIQIRHIDPGFEHLHPSDRGERHSLRLQMEHAVEDLLGMDNKTLRENGPRIIVDNLLDILDADPGPSLCPPVEYVPETSSLLPRQQMVNCYRAFIQAIRRGRVKEPQLNDPKLKLMERYSELDQREMARVTVKVLRRLGFNPAGMKPRRLTQEEAEQLTASDFR